MIGLSQFINENKYDYHCIIPPFYMQMIRLSLLSYKNDNREGYSNKEIDKCLDILKQSHVE